MAQGTPTKKRTAVPRTDDELWETVRQVTGLSIPRVKVCPHHCAPFTAFADAFFARSPFAVWKGSRGFAGKSTLLAALSATEAAVLGAKVALLGGSGEQSSRIHAITSGFWDASSARDAHLDGEPTIHRTKFKSGGSMSVLMASQRSVRGPHPSRLREDEVDEFALPIFLASLGQPMPQPGIPSQVVCSSTHQYADGTMTYVLRWAEEQGFPLYQWCYKETSAPGGWLSLDEVEIRKRTMPAMMWQTEVELAEPSVEGRAFDTEAVEDCFPGPMLPEPSEAGQEFEAPISGVSYYHGADWGKKSDACAFIALKPEDKIKRLVAYRKTLRKPWPILIGAFDAQRKRYPGKACHDATGIGGVIDDYHEGGNLEAVYMTGRARLELLNDYIMAVEHRHVRYPRIPSLYNAHKYCTQEDLFGGGHPPDEIVGCAMAWKASKAPGAIDLSAFGGVNLSRPSIGVNMPRR